MHLTTDQRKKIVQHSLDNKSVKDAQKDIEKYGIEYAFSKIDTKNGYIEMVGAFEGIFQMCYWNMTNGHQLIAVYQENCGPICEVAYLDFYIFDKQELTQVNLCSVLPTALEKDFFAQSFEENLQKMQQEDVIATLLFDLPQKGKNITVYWGNNEEQTTYEKYNIIGNKMELIWEDGKFSKSNVFWSK